MKAAPDDHRLSPTAPASRHLVHDLLQLAATLFMTGVIWFVQVVHYPLMARVGRSDYAEYQKAHQRRTGWIVAPPMLVEAVTALISLISPPAGVPIWQAWLGMAIVILIWGCTALLQVPRHRELEQGFSGVTHRALVASNWIRVVLWSTRSLMLLSWIAT